MVVVVAGDSPIPLRLRLAVSCASLPQTPRRQKKMLHRQRTVFGLKPTHSSGSTTLEGCLACLRPTITAVSIYLPAPCIHLHILDILAFYLSVTRLDIPPCLSCVCVCVCVFSSSAFSWWLAHHRVVFVRTTRLFISYHYTSCALSSPRVRTVTWRCVRASSLVLSFLLSKQT